MPVWTLLPRIDTDWRWPTEGTTTVWYPTMRLFRQTTGMAAWTDVFADVADALEAMRQQTLSVRPARN